MFDDKGENDDQLRKKGKFDVFSNYDYTLKFKRLNWFYYTLILCIFAAIIRSEPKMFFSTQRYNKRNCLKC